MLERFYTPFYRLVYYAYILLTVPVSTVFLSHSKNVHPAYRMTFLKRLWLSMRMCLNNMRLPSGSLFTLHLAMAMKILETPPDVPGDIIECGTYKGGSAANLSLVCKIAGRKLKIFDSFEGLPEIAGSERQAEIFKQGDFAGTLEEVKANIRKGGAIECCEFVKGWFKDTLPGLNSPVLLAFLDVDLEDSLQTCVRAVWPNLAERGYIFTHESVFTDYVALFYSEKWWKKYFNQTPPGFIGAGSGLPLGTYYVGPFDEIGSHPLQHSNGGGYTQKSMSGYWAYYPDEVA
jgi:O-methyltransferase